MNATVEKKVTLRDQSKARTREKVLEAARCLFGEHGYQGATIRDIAARSTMSTGAVFANFNDKADLFLTILTEDFE
ncbi:MAG: TetR family transcriptional regulator, partial [Parcubacteria group bacterium]|nr:TetR family transcriptional regulator [Parcubacteria group bacterium]